MASTCLHTSLSFFGCFVNGRADSFLVCFGVPLYRMLGVCKLLVLAHGQDAEGGADINIEEEAGIKT